jgi:hypothetical protein
MVIVIVSLFVAVILIIFAGRLTSIDAAAISTVNLVKDEISSLDRSIGDINSRLAKLRNSASSPKISSQMSPTQVSPVQDSDENADVVSSTLKDEKAALFKRRELAIVLWNSAMQTELQQTGQDKLKDTNFITATFLTRVGVLVILLFLVQLLISLYKYNTRMVAFYASRLDSFRVWDGDVAKLKALLGVMIPTHVDFGHEPRHPVEYLVDAWRRRKGEAEGRVEKKGGAVAKPTVNRGTHPEPAEEITVVPRDHGLQRTG